MGRKYGRRTVPVGQLIVKVDEKRRRHETEVKVVEAHQHIVGIELGDSTRDCPGQNLAQVDEEKLRIIVERILITGRNKIEPG